MRRGFRTVERRRALAKARMKALRQEELALMHPVKRVARRYMKKLKIFALLWYVLPKSTHLLIVEYFEPEPHPRRLAMRKKAKKTKEGVEDGSIS